jgi:DNA-binding NarL/FixJ family response regulator
MLYCQISDRPKIKVLIVDDHELTRFTLKLWLTKHANLEVIGDASNSRDAIGIVRTHHPDAIVLDLNMPTTDGLSTAIEIKQIAPQTKIIAHSSLELEPKELEAITGVIDSFCVKDVSISILIESIFFLTGTKIAS